MTSLKQITPQIAENTAGKGWQAADIRKVLDGPGPRPPSIFRRRDGVHLLYPGLVHAFVGEPESMKSWAWQVCAAQILNDGGVVTVLDFENTPETVLDRMRLLGCLDDDLIARFRYFEPPELVELGKAQYKDLLSEISDSGSVLVVIDGVTDAMALHGLEADRSNSHAALFDRKFVKPIARLGSAVVLIDHVTKDQDSRGRYAIGAQHKLAAITGAQYYFKIANPFGEGREGVAGIYLKKDKPGKVGRYACGSGRHIADVHLISTELRMVEASLEPPDSSTDDHGDARELLFEAVSLCVEKSPGLSKNAICEDVGRNRSKVLAALERLEGTGYIDFEKGARNANLCRSLKPYRAGDPL